MILQELLRLQHTFGYLPRQQLSALAQRLGVPLYRIHEVASFYPHFTLFSSPEVERQEADLLPELEVAVCRDMSCQLRGASEYLAALTEAARRWGGRVRVRGVSCLGRCDRAPAVRLARRQRHGEALAAADPHAPAVPLTLLGRPLSQVVAALVACVEQPGETDVPHDRDEPHLPPQSATGWRIDPYREEPVTARYAALRAYVALAETAAGRRAEGDRMVRALQTAQLLGMGGAGGRTYKKWTEVREAVGERRYVICNADESEPGTFKDRELLLRVPHLVIEGLLLAALVVGAEQAYIYLRHEYEEPAAALRRELEAARQQMLWGESILGSGLRCDVQVVTSPGGYICGEQTALVQALQDERAEPRNRPPELQTNGLWNLPTLVNNVETLAWVPSTVQLAGGTGAWYAALGEPGYRGARFFSVSGDVARPGVYEVPIGITLGRLLEDYCGGMRDGLPLKAVALSGPSGGFLPAELPLDSFSPEVRPLVQSLCGPQSSVLRLLDLPLDLGVTRRLRLMLGAAIVVYSAATDLVEQTLSCLRFFAAESCGKCLPCRSGTQQLVQLGEQLQSGQLERLDLDRWSDREQGMVLALAQAMGDTAICGLGTSAPNPLKSLLCYFPDDVAAYLRK
ncbi:MAG: NADH-ubiquinone oxidoreductase-F iron-sulfur binding region domain-containing protein [Pirellulales bacterium]